MSELKTKLKEAFEKGGSEYLEKVIVAILDAGFEGYETRDKVVRYLQHEYDRKDCLPDKTFLYALACQMKELKSGKKKMYQVDLELARQFETNVRQIQYLRSKVGAVKYRKGEESSKTKVAKSVEKEPKPAEKPTGEPVTEKPECKAVLRIELVIPPEILELIKRR